MIKILILEDVEGLCNQLKDYFKDRGYKVFAVTNGKDALSVIKKESPQILVLDINMEGINGLDVLKKAKEDIPNVKAIMVTGIDDDDTQRQAKALGADEYLTKPFSYDVLETVIIHKINEVLKLEGKQNK
jgi:DNA-binding response OmpR family regulator